MMARATRAKKALDAPVIETAMLAPSAIETVAYGRLKRARENVRKTDAAADVESLADDIAAHGLLQCLIGYPGGPTIDNAAIYIVGGGRRLQALALLEERGTINAEWPVPVLIRDQSDAIELSLSENLARRDMNPADEFIAFAALLKTGGRSPADLARQFGFTERYIKQRLRLAGLAAEVLEALRSSIISLEQALEYAKTSDSALQLKVFRAIQRGAQYNRGNVWSIRAGIASEGLTEDSAIFRFIDRETYEREGGGYDEDLFAELKDGDGRRLRDGQLARTIATRCLQFQGARVLTQAQREYPSATGFVISPTLMIDGTASAPSGFAEIKGGWDSNLGRHVEIRDCWKRALDQEAPIQIVVGITREQALADDDDGSPLGFFSDYDRSRFFVPKDRKKQVLPSAERSMFREQALTPEQQEAQEIDREARVNAARLAAPRFSDLPGFEGRAYYSSNWISADTKPGEPRSGPRTPYFEVKVFVTEEEIAARMDEGRQLARDDRAERERVKAERKAAKEAEQDEAGAALAVAIAAISELPAPPAVVLAAEYADEEPSTWFLWASGDYFDLREDDPEADNAMGLEGLAGLFEFAVKITAWFSTLAAFEEAATSSGDDQPAISAVQD